MMKHWRQRENRMAVRISVRVRTDDGWTDATVRNVSSRGMMVHSLRPMRRNQFVEIARGHTRVVGRIAWSEDAVWGLQAQDRVDIAALLAKPEAGVSGARQERRAAPRPKVATASTLTVNDRAERSRWLGQAVERTMLLSAIACTCAFAVSSALEAMERPLEQVQVALAN